MITSTLFSSARFKLTVGYTVFFAAVFIAFSALMYQVQVHTLERTRAIPSRFMSRFEPRFENKPAQDNLRYLQLDPEVDPAFKLAQERVDVAISNLKAVVLKSLIFLNMVAIFVGAVVAYILAGYSLQPLEHAYQKQKQFLQDVSHELRTPLSVMQIELDVVTRQVTGQKGSVSQKVFTKMITSLKEEVSLMSNLVADILQLSRMEQHELVIQHQHIDIRKVIMHVLAQFQTVAEEKEITLSFKDQVKANQALMVVGSFADWQQLLRILVDNAIKYSHAKGLVIILLEKESTWLKIKVQDTGVGIAARDSKHIFERFYRADKARSTPGSGLGLAIAQQLVVQLDASLAVTSKPGLGSTFEIKVPILPTTT